MADDDRREPDDAALRLPSLRSAFRRGRTPAPQPDAESSSADSASPVQVEDRLATPRRQRSLKFHLPGPVAALVTGCVVGLALVGLTAASVHLCTSVRGTSSCGTPGILLWLVITVLAILLGSVLLRLAGVRHHSSTSVLGVSLVGVLVLAALLPVLGHQWVAIVVPALSMLCYLSAWWLTTTYADV